MTKHFDDVISLSFDCRKTSKNNSIFYSGDYCYIDDGQKDALLRKANI